MSRVKTFDSTGLATAGRLYAGDLNAIQDQYADLYNLSQALGVSSVALGESGLQLLRYGAGEARLSGAMRTDGILRALGGLFAGAYTTTARDAIPLGSRPFTLLIFNTNTNQFEYNAGTDPTPNWQPLSPTAAQTSVGMSFEWDYGAASIPSNYLLQYGQNVLRATYPTLHGLASASGYPHGNGDGSTTFGIADKRGRISAGKDDMGGTAANRITAAISGASGATLGAVVGNEGVTLATAQIPSHSHGGNTGNDSPDHSHSGTTAGRNAAHSHADSGHAHAENPAQEGSSFDAGFPLVTLDGQRNGYNSLNTGTGFASLGTESADHGHSFSTGGRSANHTHPITAEGGGGAHLNTQPTIIVNKIVRAL